MLLIPDSSSTNTPDYTQLRYQTDQAYFKTDGGDVRRSSRIIPEAIESTLEIAEKCDLTLDLGRTTCRSSRSRRRRGGDARRVFRQLSRAKDLPGGIPDATAALTGRLEHEISVINADGICGIFPHRPGFHPCRTGHGCVRGSRAGGALPGASCRMPSASPMSTRSSTISSSSAS